MAIQSASSQSSIELYRQLPGSSSNRFFCSSLDFRNLPANAAFANGMGKGLNEIVGRTVWDDFPKDEADKGANLSKLVFDRAEASPHEMLNQGHDGNRSCRTTVTPFFGNQGQVSSAFATSKDGTKHNQAESVLKASEAKYRALVETTGTGYLILDGKGSVVDANFEYVRLSGHSDVREILGRSVLEWTAAYEIERNDKAVAQCARDGFIRNLVIDYVDRNGQTTPVEINATVSGEGDSLQIISLCRDITERKQAEQQLKASQERLQLALSGGELGFWDWSVRNDEVLFSEHWFTMLGLPKDAVRLSLDSWIQRIHHDDLAGVNVALASHLKRQSSAYMCEYRVRHQDGRWLWLLDRGRVVEWDKAGAPVRAVGTFFDITQRKQAELELASSKSRYQGILQNMKDAYWRVDQEGRIVEANHAICQMHGYSMAELLGMSISDFDAVETAEDTRKQIEKIQREGHDVFETKHRCRDGRVIDIEVSASLASDAPGNIDAFHRDITERKQLQDRILKLALHDPLTQLPNRTLFFDRFSQAVALARRNEKQVGLLFLDFDGFKPVNDRHGHDAGDRVLKTSAERLLAAVRGIDTVARLGGDEFGMILGELDGPQEAVLVAAKLLAAVAQPISLSEGSQASVSASIGISMHPIDGSEMDVLLDKADAAMYQSKHCGGNRFTFWGSSISGHPDEGPWLQMGSELLVGVDEIDSQHSHLIDLGNRLHNSIKGNLPRNEVRQQLVELIDYVKFHFLTESQWMQRCLYPGKPLHDRAHARLLADASQFEALLDQGGDRFILHLIRDWLITHIETEDRALGEFLNQA